MIKVMKYQIIKPLDCKWEQFGKYLRDLQYETQKAMNKTIQYCWEYSGFELDYKAKYNGYPDKKAKKEIFDPLTSLQGCIYNQIVLLCPKSNTANLSQSIQKASLKWRSDKYQVLTGKISIPNFKLDVPIDIKNKNIKIIKTAEDNYNLQISLLSNEYKKELGLSHGFFNVAIDTRNYSKRSIINRIATGEYKLNSSCIMKSRNKSKWFVLINYEFDPPKHQELNPENFMGVNIGIFNSVSIAYNYCLKRYYLEGGEVESYRAQMEARRRQLLHQGKCCGPSRIGHGIHKRIEPIEAINERISRFKDTINHRYSSKIIELALQNNCGVIQIEDLTGISKEDKYLKNWSYFDLQNKIIYKAETAGITVVKISPCSLVIRCSKCGAIHPDNWIAGEKRFKCVVCGYDADVDFNAARNLATPLIDRIIEETEQPEDKEE